MDAAYKNVPDGDDDERDTLLPSNQSWSRNTKEPFCVRSIFNGLHIAIAFVAGVLACFLGQYLFCRSNCLQVSSSPSLHSFSSSSSEVPHFPPASPTNAVPSLFPSNVGYAVSHLM